MPVAKSPSPVALLLSVKKWVMDTTVLGIPSFSEITADHQPHLTCLFPLRSLRAAVASPFTERVQNAQSTTKRFSPGEHENKPQPTELFCDSRYVFLYGSLVQPFAKIPNPATAGCIKSSVSETGQCSALVQATALESIVSKM